MTKSELVDAIAAEAGLSIEKCDFFVKMWNIPSFFFQSCYFSEMLILLENVIFQYKNNAI